jgi:hypothetical protein
MDRFSPEKEDFTMALVWIRPYSLPQEFCMEEILMGIGNTMGRNVKSSEATKQRKCTSYAHICVYMDMLKALLGSITLEYQDEDWNQTMDYGHIPFRYRKCHENGHLFRSCSLNDQNSKSQEGKKKDGYTTVTGRKKQRPRNKNPERNQKISIRNSFDILN